MRILQVTEASASGTLRVVEVLCERLVRDGHDVRLVIGHRPETPESVGSTLPPGCLTRLQWDHRTPTEQLRAGRQLRRTARAFDPEVVHLHSTFAGLVGVLALDRSCPLIYTPHCWASTVPRSRPLRLASVAVDRIIARRCDLVGAVSQSEAEQARRLRARQVAVVANGVPELDDGAAVPARHRSMPLVLAGGRLVTSRQAVATGRILCSVADIAEVLWVGGGDDAQERADTKMGVPITGWLPHADAMAQFAEATAYLHWSSADGQSVAVLEAIARDVVVIASDIPPNRELLGDHQLCGSEADATALLRRVVDDPTFREELLADQRARRTTHGAEAMVEGWSRVYERSILEARSLAGR